MIYRALFGSVERFFAIPLEDHAAALPAWLAAIKPWRVSGTVVPLRFPGPSSGG